MAQTSYAREHSAANVAGGLGDTGPNRVESYLNDEGADIPAGIAVVEKALGTADLFDSTNDTLLGIVVNSYARDPDDLDGLDVIKDGGAMNVLTEGTIWVVVEEAVAVTDPVYCRFSAAGEEVLGAFRTDADTSDAREVKGARFLTETSGAGIALLKFSNAAELS